MKYFPNEASPFNNIWMAGVFLQNGANRLTKVQLLSLKNAPNFQRLLDAGCLDFTEKEQITLGLKTIEKVKETTPAKTTTRRKRTTKPKTEEKTTEVISETD